LSAEEERRQKRSPTSLGLTEGLRVWFGTGFIGAANTIYGHPARARHPLHAAGRGRGVAGVEAEAAAAGKAAAVKP
jgi:hypothetical protein